MDQLNKADLAYSHNNTVVAIFGSALYMYEIMGPRRRSGYQRTTPNILVAEGDLKTLFDTIHKEWPGIIEFPVRLVKSEKFLELHKHHVYACGMCGGRTSSMTPCSCERDTPGTFTRCRTCTNIITYNIACQSTHCWSCCDCWSFTCGCASVVYKHGQIGRDRHYEFRFDDQQHPHTTCGACKSHCACMNCECGETHVGMRASGPCRYCMSRKHITDCCSSDNAVFSTDRGARLRFRHLPDVKFFEATTFERNQSRRFVSPEVEVSGYKISDWRKLVRAEETLTKLHVPVVHDNSVPDGFELNVQPANGDAFVENVETITEVVAGLRPQVSERCGLHIHGDARDYTFEDVGKLLHLFLKIEPLVYNMVREDRRRVKYCISSIAYEPFAKPGIDYEKELYTFLYSGETDYARIKREQKKNDATRSIRYRGVNLHSFFYQQTVEFRHHHGTIKPAEIISWGMFVAFLMDVAKWASWDWLEEIPNGIIMPRQFTAKVVDRLEDGFPNAEVIKDIVKQRHSTYAIESDVASEEPPRRPAARRRTATQWVTLNNANTATGWLEEE